MVEDRHVLTLYCPRAHRLHCPRAPIGTCPAPVCNGNNHPFPYCSSQCVLSSPLSWQHTCPSPYSRRHSQTSLVVTRTLRAFLLSFSTHASSPHSTASMVLPFSPPQMTPSTDTSNFCLSGHLFLTMMDLQSPTMYGSNSASSFSTIF